MPIEIKELHIRVAVNAAPAGQQAASTSSTASDGKAGGGGDQDKDAIVAECVEQVLQILQNKRER